MVTLTSRPATSIPSIFAMHLDCSIAFYDIPSVSNTELSGKLQVHHRMFTPALLNEKKILRFLQHNQNAPNHEILARMRSSVE